MSDVALARILGALRFVDATTAVWIRAPLEVSAPGVRFIRNLRGAYAISFAPGLEDHLEDFEEPPPPPPALGDIDFTVTVTDATGKYLARTVDISLPRDPDPDNIADPASLFKTINVPLFPSPTAAISPGWGVVRASVRRPDGTRLAGAYLRLRRASQPTTADPPLARGLADARGEALVAACGIPATNWDSEDGGPVLSSEIDVVLEAYFDQNAGSPVNPDVIDSRRLLTPPDPAALPSASVSLKLASGREVAIPVVIAT